jgi:hypothetical protein
MSGSESPPPPSDGNDSVALTTERIKELIPIYERERDRHPKNSFPHEALQYHINDLKAKLKKAEEEGQTTESSTVNASLDSNAEEEDKKG